jgi:hypothetical protein
VLARIERVARPEPAKRLGAELTDKVGLVRTLPMSCDNRQPWAPQLSADGRLIAVPVGSRGPHVGAIEVREVATGRLVREPAFPLEDVTSFLFTPDNCRLVVGVRLADGVRFAFHLVDLDGDGKRRLDRIADPNGWPTHFHLDAAGKRFAFSAGSGTRVVDLESGKELLRTEAPQAEGATYTRLSADGRRAFTASAWADKEGEAPRHGRLRIDDLEAGKTVATADFDYPLWYPFVDGPTGQPGAYAEPAGEPVIELYDAPTGKSVRRLPLPRQDKAGRNQGLLLTGGGRIVCLWPGYRVTALDLPSFKEVWSLDKVEGFLRWSVSADGRVLAIWAGEGVRLYRLPDPPKPAGAGPGRAGKGKP